MRRGVSYLAALLLMAGPARGDVNFITGGDLFDADRGATITDISPIGGSVGEALITPVATGVEPGTLFFEDGSDGTVHFAEFETATPVTLGGFNLWANGDTPSFPEKRTFKHFRLQAKVGQSFQTIYDEDVEVPYEGNDGDDFLVVSTTVTPVTASAFRAEFTQHGSGVGTGPRIQELDGFPPKLCGDANYNGSLSSTDALVALRTAVGTASCVRCICNVNNMSGITATDALLILQSAVGQPTELNCFTCVVGE